MAAPAAMTYGVPLMADTTKRSKDKKPKTPAGSSPPDVEKRPARSAAADAKEAQAARNRARERSGSED